jgi:hypothetical protein
MWGGIKSPSGTISLYGDGIPYGDDVRAFVKHPERVPQSGNEASWLGGYLVKKEFLQLRLSFG